MTSVEKTSSLEKRQEKEGEIVYKRHGLSGDFNVSFQRHSRSCSFFQPPALLRSHLNLAPLTQTQLPTVEFEPTYLRLKMKVRLKLSWITKDEFLAVYCQTVPNQQT